MKNISELDFSTLADALRKQIIDEFDNTFFGGLLLLSKRKKNKIKKWIIKALRRNYNEKH